MSSRRARRRLPSRALACGWRDAWRACHALALLAGASAVAGSATWAQGYADPTQPPSVIASAPDRTPAAPPRISAIFISPSRRVAVVDGNRVSVGDRVGDSRVSEILAHSVTLRGPSGTVELRLIPMSALRPAGEQGSGP